MFKKNLRIFFSLCHPPATPECPQKISVQSVQPFGRLKGTYIRMSCFQEYQERDLKAPPVISVLLYAFGNKYVLLQLSTLEYNSRNSIFTLFYLKRKCPRKYISERILFAVWRIQNIALKEQKNKNVN